MTNHMFPFVVTEAEVVEEEVHQVKVEEEAWAKNRSEAAEVHLTTKRSLIRFIKEREVARRLTIMMIETY
jgi:hypothetical protein